MDKKKLLKKIESLFYEIVQITKNEYSLYICDHDLKEGKSSRLLFTIVNGVEKATLMPKETLESFVEELKGEGIYTNSEIRRRAIKSFNDMCKTAYIKAAIRIKKHQIDDIAFHYPINFQNKQAS